MVEDLEIEITDLMANKPSAISNKNTEEMTKKLKEEKELREKLESEKKKLETQLDELNKKNTGNESGYKNLIGWHKVGTNCNVFIVKMWREKCEKLEKEKSELAAKKESSDQVDLDTLHQVRQEKHKLQKEVFITSHYSSINSLV